MSRGALKCDFCRKEMEAAAAKIYMAPIVPGNRVTAFMSSYSHHCEICNECREKYFLPRMTPRKRRNGAIAKPKKTTKK